jgi:hypothetical protein
MADVLSTERVIAVRREYEQRADGWSREIALTALSHEELRARLERAEGALGKALKGLQCHVNGLPAELCGCKFCRGLQAALSTATEEQEKANGTV